jgi:hypothetical protein
MTDMSFEDILNQPLADIEAPKALPIGTYLGIIDGQPEFVKLGQNQTDAVQMNIKPIKAIKVDEKQLSEVLNGAALSDKRIRHRVFITQDSKHRLKQFLVDHLGISADIPVKQGIAEAMGKQLVVELGHQSSTDGTQVFNTVKSTANVSSL